ncbi:MAG: hypothetical protein JW801_17265 [Bacteroidales bacterium]|nr:hypothetical protein [Bacteroidales bacterium]
MDLIPKDDFLKKKNDEEIVRKTAGQVIKDFSLFGLDIDFPVNIHMAYDELFDQLTLVIEKLLRNNQSRLYSLLYAIDISEKSINKGAREMGDLPLQETITHLILERELKKVLTREHFRNANPSE